ncbi:MAG: diguanylate cyclase [Planctomycetes bacterium]|nr:diguanylate cyclase [Planctomycetota bacterium]
MHPQQIPHARNAKVLAILNHRGENLRRLGDHFEQLGYQAKLSSCLEQSVDVFNDKEISSAIVAPLTLSPQTLEWETLLKLLSPHCDIPWLLLPWADAQPKQLTALLHHEMALADWVQAPFEPHEVETRVRNLLRYQELIKFSQGRAKILEAQLITDHKTELSNDRHFRDRFNQEFARSQRHHNPLTLLLLDIDDFKQINDSSSYDFGDTVLRTIAEVIRHSVRTIDIPARIGGDEYAVLMPHTSLDEGVGVANRILTSTAGLLVNDQKYRTEVHLSIGTACFDGTGLSDTSQLFLQANEALKAAKKAGKNRVYFYDSSEHSSAG